MGAPTNAKWTAAWLALALAGCKITAGTGVPDAAVSSAPLDCAADSGDWPMYGQNLCNTRTAQSSPITPQRVPGLAVQWTYAAAGDISATPAVVGGQLFFPDWGGMMNCVDAQTGRAVWTRSIAAILGDEGDAGDAVDDGGPAADAAGDAAADAAADAQTASISYSSPATTGIVARGTPVVTANSVIFGVATAGNARMAAVDRATGALAWQTLLDPHPYALITSSPALDGNVVYVGVSSGEEGAVLVDTSYACCTFRGSVAALDATTGAILWQTPTIDDDVYLRADGSLSGYAGSAVWSGTPTVDHKRSALYITTGNNYSEPADQADSGQPLPDGDRIESIIALDLTSGKLLWSQRMTSGDVWNFALFSNHDYDFGCAANLFQATIGGVTHDVVGAGQKSGVYWAVDADTGTTLWKTQVGPGGHLGGIHWGAAVDGVHVYAGVNDESGMAYTLGGTHPDGGASTTTVGSWAALDPATGETLWQVPNPSMTAPLAGASVNGPLATVNGVVFAGSMDADGTMFALDGATGAVRWSFKSGATVYGGPAIVGGVVYWGNGYPSSRLGFGTPGGTLYAFSIPGD
jgi:polyvinyl alcohol dehydrogenase (cytochrome)